VIDEELGQAGDETGEETGSTSEQAEEDPGKRPKTPKNQRNERTSNERTVISAPGFDTGAVPAAGARPPSSGPPKASGSASSGRLPQRAQDSASRSFSNPQAMQIAFFSSWEGGLASAHSPFSKAYHLPLWAPITQKRPSSSLMRSCFSESANSWGEIFCCSNFSRRRE